MARLTSSKKASSINTEVRHSSPIVEYKKVSLVGAKTRPDRISLMGRSSITTVITGRLNIHYPSTTLNFPSLGNFPWSPE